MSLDRARSAGERADAALRVAVGAARWIRSAAADDGRWLANPDARGTSALAPEPASLYAGAPGIVLFFLELAGSRGRRNTCGTRGRAAAIWPRPGARWRM
ncbi:hypothetical protein [Nonomuraea polychroma]|uniref:hypothetical protein n=1 Tax=Nonomuraea polychroma TaxID=46176 RepID=UPI001F4D9E75|nr:hypothetical protein [Nonomuraea polychroma]